MKPVQDIKQWKTKLIQAVMVIFCILLPWSATAVNQGNLSNKLFFSKSSQDLVESLLVKSLIQIAQGEPKQAMETVDKLIELTPNFKLAHLIRGDLLSAQAKGLSSFGNTDILSKKSRREIEGLREEARTRVNYYFSTDNKRQVPDLLVQMNQQQQHLVLIDTVKSRLFLYKKSETGLRHVADYYVTIGKNGAVKMVEGDKRTPVGVYFSGKKIAYPLSDFYGDGAYPLNYPNELDLHQKKTGSGIWLHGTPKDTYSRPPRASDGCVVVSNPDLNKLKPVLDTGNVPVIISDTIKWVDSRSSAFNGSELKALNDAIETWRADWVAQNTNKYLSHYSQRFFYDKGQIKEWSDHKRRVQASKPKVSVQVNNISMFGYPGKHHITGVKTTKKQAIVVVNFEQVYASPTLKDKMIKRQYWTKENNQWKIIYEGAA